MEKPAIQIAFTDTEAIRYCNNVIHIQFISAPLALAPDITLLMIDNVYEIAPFPKLR